MTSDLDSLAVVPWEVCQKTWLYWWMKSFLQGKALTGVADHGRGALDFDFDFG